ncbi:WD repeat-containing protein WRAP73 [Vanrija pseudolonga]|uniref:WD repeat-containing protein WRAP73 n=1 Tax=Vanrija pseudolonga TaxID=143232 RepID=A0AAF0YFJ8_9TREE|nr:WD repeat-containing protein WRAP73 [Vanrija pseudolonga]
MDTYQFSQVYRASAISFSPGSTFIAAAIEDHVMIRSTSSLDLIRTWHCSSSPEAPSPGSVTQRKPHTVDFLEWSSDGSRLLAFTSKGGQAWVLDLSSGEQVAHLANGVTRVEWGGSSILAWSDRGVSWHHLPTGTSRFVQYAQQAQKGHAWSPGHRYIALLERHHGRCYVGVYDSQSLIRHFPVSTEASGVSWSPCGKWIAAWDWKVNYAISFHTPAGTMAGSFKPANAILGVSAVAWSPNGRHVIVGGYDGTVHVLESESFYPIAALRGYEGDILGEPPTGHTTLTQFTPTTAAPHRSGVQHVGVSEDGSILFFCHDSALHVYTLLPSTGSATPDISHWSTAVLLNGVKSIRPCPTTNRIAFVTGAAKLYMWDKLGVEAVKIPGDVLAVDVHWAPDGHTASVSDRRLFCLVYEEGADESTNMEGEGWEELD